MAELAINEKRLKFRSETLAIKLRSYINQKENLSLEQLARLTDSKLGFLLGRADLAIEVLSLVLEERLIMPATSTGATGGNTEGDEEAKQALEGRANLAINSNSK